MIGTENYIRGLVEGYVLAHGLTVEWEGEIGFGRECVGLIDPARDSYVAYTYGKEQASIGGEGTGTGPPEGVGDAYHKDTYIAVLGRGPGAEEQLAVWVRDLAEKRARFEYRMKDVPDLSTLVYGHRDEMTAVAP